MRLHTIPRRRPITRRSVVAVGAALLALAPPAEAQELTLTDALAQAMASHPALAAAEARVFGADAARDGAEAQRLPMVSSSASLTRFQEPMLVAPLHAFDPTNIPDFDRSLVRGELGAQYTLFEGGARGARIRGAGAAADASRSAYRLTEAQLVENVTRAYLAVLSTRSVLDAATGNRQTLEAEVDRATRHYQEGTAAQVEVLRAEAALLDALASETSANAGVALTERALARLMGLAPEALVGRALSPAQVDIGIEESALHPALEGRYRNRDVARARVDQERATRLPQVTATAGLLDYGTLSDDHVAEWQAGLRISWPIFTGGARGASIRRAEADLLAAEEDIRVLELDLANATDAAEAAVVEAQARAAALQASVAQWEEVARIEALSVQEGAGLQSDLLRAQAGLFQARAGYARAHHEAILASVRLAAARGVLTLDWMNSALETDR